jgi:5-methylthioadenosine/S-adenosylhomocysteine deaminase
MTTRVYLAQWVVPISSPPIANAAVAVTGGRIVYVGSASEAPEGQRIDLGSAVLLPGLVNTHTHLELTAFRGFLEDLPFLPWIRRLTESRERAMTNERRRASARVGIAEGLLAGVTSFADCSDSGTSAAALGEFGARGIVYQEVFGPDPASCGQSISELRERLARLTEHASPLVEVGISPHAPYTVSDELFAASADLAHQRGMRLAVHVAEGASESELITEGAGAFATALRARKITVAPRGRSTIELLWRLGVLGPGTLLIHGVRLTTEDIRLVAEEGCGVAHCPASNAKLGHGIAPVADMQSAGIAVGLGSDSVASSNRMDLLDESRLAALCQRIRTQRPDVMGAAAALRLATLGGAEALGLADRVGSLAPGKEADLAAFPLDPVSDASTYGPEEALVFGRGGRQACLTTVGGRELVRDGRLVATVSEDARVVRELAKELAGDRQNLTGAG